MRLKSENGSITLEAALVLPFFMLFIVFMASIIRISVAEIALNKSVSETAQIISTHAYPATILSDQVENLASDKLSGISTNIISLEDVEKLVGTSLKELLDFDPSSSNYIDQLGASVVTPIVQEKFADNMNSNSATGSNINVEVELPGSINGGADSYIGITATYDLDLTVPFVDRTITIKKQAYERLWVGGY
ncbi:MULTISPECIES: TadE/TadG family type IV pilus assembly protein [Oceanobacillus]|uniref:Pilus assembly protein n=1 Tax=Oceanobacillus profundus TaxID=372463 RepID=A0A417YJI5_9BACI|nr:TadE family protein [Oceanobacillus profundus]MBR3118345.1 pilus assembly protein [Oceanobacillus sp.]MCM3396914.1 pilus assembly protein [Oceanobacillus profundus]RHW33097.1 pilus assembly protein [Oceanobacillus profundus]